MFAIQYRVWPILALLVLGGCSTVYYDAMEKMGYHKRDILLTNVAKARDSQQEAKQQFQTALERFKAVTRFRGGKLEDKYNQLKAEFDASQAKADAVHKRVNDIEDVGEALFSEWETELGQYSNAGLRQSSKQQMGVTRRRYDQLVAKMRKAESKIEPVLNTFRDQVLFLKHNLNAQAIASIQGEARGVEVDVSSLIKDMESAIREADTFIRSESKTLQQAS